MSKYDPEKLIANLNKTWGSKPCPLCGENLWAVSDSIFELREYYGGRLRVGSTSVMPIVPITCSNCGNTIFINAIVSKVVEKSEGNAIVSKVVEKPEGADDE